MAVALTPFKSFLQYFKEQPLAGLRCCGLASHGRSVVF